MIEMCIRDREYIQIKEKDEGTGLIALSKGVFETIAQISIDDVDQAYAWLLYTSGCV